jgi:hypothetical protein
MSAADAAGARALEAAREAVRQGRDWRARDILLERVEHHPDPAALRLLGEVLYGMGDLPRAGAAWFAAGTKGPQVDEAVAAWREQARDDFAAMWRSLPASVKDEPRPPRIEALRARALSVEPEVVGPALEPPVDGAAGDHGDDEGGTDGAQVIAWILAAVFVVLAVIGAVTVLGWIVPST